MITRVTTKGQVTIPAEIRAAAQIAPGAKLEWEYDSLAHRLIATKPIDAGNRTLSMAERIALVRGTATTKMTTDEIMALTRGPDDE